MPTLADLQRSNGSSSALDLNSDRGNEVMVADSRARLSPSQQVEQKLRGTLGSGPMLTAGVLARRSIKPR